MIPSGNQRPPPIEEYLRWIVITWDAIPNDTIKKSFKICGLTQNLWIHDGLDDDQILY